MKPTDTGYLYDQIAAWWDDQQGRTIGLNFLQRAINLCSNRREALDVGCGSGGRIMTALLNAGFQVTGIDVSQTMIELARKRHPGVCFVHDDICAWQPQRQYNAIIAWDSIFHVPHAAQQSVVEKLCGALAQDGVVLFTAGGIDAEITGQMCDLTFYYSSLAEEEYLKILKDMRCKCILLERDQYPVDHVVIIGTKE